MDTDEHLGAPAGQTPRAVVKVNSRPDEPDTPESLADRSGWSIRAIALGVLALVIMVLVLLLIIQGALDQAP